MPSRSIPGGARSWAGLGGGARKRPQERGDEADVVRRNLSPELVARHGGDRGLQRRNGAVMEIGRQERSLAQRRHLEDVAVGLVARDVVATKIGPGDRAAAIVKIVAEESEALEEVSAHRHALMACRAAILLEERIAGLLVRAQRVALPAQESVETRARRNDRSLIFGDAGADE